MPDYRKPGTSRDQIEDVVSRNVRRSHPDSEDSDRPVPPARVPTQPDWPPPSVTDLRPGSGNPRSEPPIAKQAKFWGFVAKIIAGVSAAVTVVGGGFTWAVKYVVRAEIAALRDDLDPLALKQKRKDPEDPKPPSLEDRFNVQNQKLDSIDKKIGSPNDPQSDLGKKLDRIDDILTKQFGESTKTTPPPAVGPTAKKQGRQ